MNKSELVSIIMPTYNCGKFISASIESVLAQTMPNFELIVADDCSTDNTEEIVNKYASRDCRIKYFKMLKNSGASVARTQAMKMAKGDYIAFLDSDDLWFPRKLEKQISFMKRKKCVFSCTQYNKIAEDGSSLHKTVKVIEKTDYKRLLLDCPVGNSTVMYDVRAMGKFTVPNIRKQDDDALWLKMLKKEKYIYGLNETLTSYRVRKGSVSRNKLSLVYYSWYLYREIEHLTVLKSIFYIWHWGMVKLLRMK